MNKNGFTLIELLAVLVILAIIALITVVSVNFIIKDAKSSLTEQQIANIEKAAKVYYLKEGMSEEAECISVADLLEKGYIEGNAVINPETVENMTGSVKITYSGNKYHYTYDNDGCILCTMKSQESTTKYSRGDIISCNLSSTPDEFYIIEDASLAATSVKAITSKNINISTYRQSDDAGTVAFSTGGYWAGAPDGYFVYGIDGNDIIKPIVDNYVSYLNEKLTGVTGTLLSTTQAEAFGCYGESCTGAPHWLTATTYWLGNYYGSGKMRYIKSNKYYGTAEYYNGTLNGVRPVITISTSDIG